MRGLEQVPWLYDALMWCSERLGGLGRWRRKLIGHAVGGEGTPPRILEVGSGTGRNLPLYRAAADSPSAGAFETLVALEPDVRVVVSSRERAKKGGAVLLAASAEALPFRDDAFHAVVSSLVFCSVDDPVRGLREVRRVLVAGGRFCMMEHVRHERTWIARWQDLVQPLWTWLAGGCRPNRDTEETVREAGFEIEGDTRRARGVMRLFVARPAEAAEQAEKTEEAAKDGDGPAASR